MKKSNLIIALLLITCTLITDCNHKPDKANQISTDSIKIADTLHQPEITSGVNAEGITNIPEIIRNEISPDYKILEVYTGNLNLDLIDDYIVVTGKKVIDPQVPADQLRNVILFITREDSSLFLCAQNLNIIECYSCGGGLGDPFTGITIKNGYFSIEQSGLMQSPKRWITIHTFKFNKEKQNFYFHQYGYETFSNDEKTYSEIIKSKDLQVISFVEYNKDESLRNNKIN